MKNYTQQIEIINSKLQTPHLPETIVRKRLYSFFEQIDGLRAIFVVAGAGYGKTTFTAQVCRDFELRTIWYRLEESDGDFLTFIQYLISGFRQIYEEFGTKTAEIIENVESINSDKRKIVATFLNEIEKYVDKNITIVLDDFHLIQKQTDILKPLEKIFEHLSPFVHFIIVGRIDPKLNISKLLTRREAIQIVERDLVFNVEEIKILYQEIFGFSLQEKHLEELYNITEGWVAGLILFNYELKGKSPQEVDKQLRKMKGTQELIYKYLEENVFDQLSDELKDFLLQTSIFSRIDVAFCDKLFGINNSNILLNKLEKKHLFTFPFDESRKSYFYHHLFQDFLNEKLNSSKKRSFILKLHERAAKLFEQEGSIDDALHHYLDAQKHKESGRLLGKLSRKLINDGRVNSFISYFERLSDEIREADPWIKYSHGRALELSGKINEAIKAHEVSYEIFKEKSSQKGMCTVSENLSSIVEMMRYKPNIGQVKRPSFFLNISFYIDRKDMLLKTNSLNCYGLKKIRTNQKIVFMSHFLH